MTNWLPDVPAGPGPYYLRLADRIEAGIAEGLLPPGAKLPPQRNLAFDIGVTVGTVGRAYALLRTRGLVSGEVGRGTYVLGDRDRQLPQAGAVSPQIAHAMHVPPPPANKLALDTTAAPDIGQSAGIQTLIHDIVRDCPAETSNYAMRLSPAWLEAGRRWLATGGWTPEPHAIVPALGGHPAILAAIAAVTAPGDRIVFEELTYSHIARSAHLAGRRPIAVGLDREGLDADEFERVCAREHPRVIFLMPALHNPTLAIMSQARRRAIAEIARRHNMWIVEDAIYSALMDDDAPPLAALAPERTFHVGSLSKAVSAGVRGGWIACPPHYASRVLTALRMLGGMNPFLLNELAARLVLSGEADAIRERVRAEIAAREETARAAFAGADFTSHPRAPFLWLKLPEPWLPATFKQAAANEGVMIGDEDEFKAARTERMHHRVRVAFTAPPARGALADGFATLRRILDNLVAGYDQYG
jgi:DNA-binding transcriptional MocR family regulator